MAHRSTTDRRIQRRSTDRAHVLLGRLPLGARDRRRGHGRGEPRARTRLAPARVPRSRDAPAIRQRGRSRSRVTRCRRRRGTRRSARRRCSSRRRRTPALAGVESELDLRARMDRVAFGGTRRDHRSSARWPTTALEWTLARAFDVARSSRARVASVGGRRGVESRPSRARPPGTTASRREELSVKAAVHDLAFEPDRFDVVVTPAAVRRGAPRLRRARPHIRASRASSRLAGDRAERLRSGSRSSRGHRRPGRRESRRRCCSPPRSCSARGSASAAPPRRSRAPCSRRAATATATPDHVSVGVGATTTGVRRRRARAPAAAR